MPERPLPIPRPADAPAELDRELRSAERYAQSALAPATRRAYESDWRVFAGWCAERGVPALGAAPAAVAAFLASEADRGFRPVTVGRRAAAIAAAHRAQDHPNPCDSGAVQQVLSGIRRRHGTAPERRAAPLDLGPLEQVLAELDTSTLAGLRDQALLLLGFAAALRRSELVALDVEHLAFTTARGLLVTIASSKTDQERAGATVAVPYARAGNDRCAVRVLRAWLEAAGIHRGPVFRRMRRGDTISAERLTGQSVALIIKRRAKAAGLGPEQLSGHSLRAGYVTAAATAGVEERKIANVSRHRTSPSCAATSARRQRSTTSAKCCKSERTFRRSSVAGTSLTAWRDVTPLCPKGGASCGAGDVDIVTASRRRRRGLRRSCTCRSRACSCLRSG